jgi:hypothetical protein
MRWWQWPTVLSLDAPAVAVLWQRLLAEPAAVHVAGPQAFVLGASVWLAYAADRWIEGWRLDPARIRTQRHEFYQRRRWPVATGWLAVLAADLAVALGELSRRDLLAGAAVLGPVLLYVLSHQLLHRHHAGRPPKEVCVAALLGAGVAAFLLSAEGGGLRNVALLLALPLALFVFLCFANCVLISVWEREIDRSHGQTSLALAYAPTADWSRRLAWLLSIGAALAWFAAPPPARAAVACTAVSAFLLGCLDRAEPRLGWRLARVLADAALLTPVVPLALRWLR